MKGKEKMIDRCIVIAPRHDTVKPVIRSYFANGNETPLVIVKGNGEWTDEDEALCSCAAKFSGGSVIECESRFSEMAAIKSVAKNVHPKTWAYVGDSTLVVGNVDECLSYAENAPGIVLARFMHPSSIDNRHPDRIEGDSICCPSPIIFHGKASSRIMKDVSPLTDNEINRALSRLYRSSWHDDFCDFSIRLWVVDADVVDKDVHSGCRFIRYSGKAAGEWAERADPPPAPFEKNVEHVDADDDGAVDAVFVIGTGSVDGNEELRYALRNLDNNCKFVRDVYICGFCPSWVDKSVVKHLNWPDRFSHAKDANIIDKLRHACEHRGIAKRILFCSDDQFNTRECTWDDFSPRYLRQYESKDRWYADRHRVWHSRLRKTLERDVQRRKSSGLDTKHVFYYQPHIWMQIDRDRFIDYARWCNYDTRDDTIIASGYFNFIDADGRPDFDHAFLEKGRRGVPEETHVAYYDGSEKDAMRILKALFPDRCRFEVAENAEKKQNAIQRTVARQVPRKKDEGKSDYDPSAATHEEISEIHEVSRMARENPSWGGLLGEISRAEELRLFGVRGWRVVWRDIVRRWREATGDGTDDASEFEKSSDDASRVVNDYMSNPEGMRTVRFGSRNSSPVGPILSFGRKTPRPAPDEVMAPLRDRIRSSLRNRMKA